ncbi:MAG: hypothetical protein ACRC80_01040 [Waterburya sp.]
MANKNPRLENLKSFKPQGEKALSKTIGIRVEQEIYDQLMSLPRDRRLGLMRKWIKDGVQKLNDCPNC